MRNRLAAEISPYLRQHAGNPVCWQPWDREALLRAEAEQKPIFLSIGYAACHWCHVMEEESFRNSGVAELLNRHFIPVKVDREERPDLDELYMRATMLFTQGQGGWPMSVFLTPEQKPFFAGTYFPPEDRYGRPGFLRLLRHVAALWADRRNDIGVDAARFAELTCRSLTAGWGQSAEIPDIREIGEAAARLAAQMEAEYGNAAGGGSRFPPYQSLDLLMRYQQVAPGERRQNLFAGILEQMAEGGITDHLGGGLFRYSTDPFWHIPHFEKMLCDQALASRCFLQAFQAARRTLFSEAAEAMLAYVLREMRHAEGGFFSSQDADSEGLEGKYYVWTREEVGEILGEADGALFSEVYDITAEGNWQAPPDRHIPPGPKNVLHRTCGLDEIAIRSGIPVRELEHKLPAWRGRLLESRSKRVPPATDTKILTDWNGLMITSLVLGGRILGSERFADAAAKAARYLLSQRAASGRLAHVCGKSEAEAVGFLPDYAFLIEALVRLHQADTGGGWLQEAELLADEVIRFFWDETEGGFFLTSSSQEPLFCRWKSTEDHVLPCANVVLAETFHVIADLRGRPDFRDKARIVLRCLGGQALASPGAYGSALSACLSWR